MDSYIVRIYRRTATPPYLVGQVEKAGTEFKENFHNSSELVRILMNKSELCEGNMTEIDAGIKNRLE